MNKLIPHIEYLLQSHDCIIIPGLGAVLAHGVLPYYDNATGVWQAPGRVVSFNPELSRTDGLLAGSVSRRDNISIEAASCIVKREAEAMRRNLDTDGKLELGAVGKLFKNGEGQISFEPADTAWLSPECMWLPDLEMPLIASREKLDGQLEFEPSYSRWSVVARRASQIAAGIALVVALGWIAVQNMGNAPMQQLASLLPTVSQQQQEAAGPVICPDQTPPAVILRADPYPDSIIENRAAKQEPVKLADSSEYYLIVASLATSADAEKFIAENPGASLGVIKKDGRYRVYAAQGQTYAQVSEIGRKAPLANRFKDSWVCHK